MDKVRTHFDPDKLKYEPVSTPGFEVNITPPKEYYEEELKRRQEEDIRKDIVKETILDCMRLIKK